MNVFNCADILKYEYKSKFWLDDGAVKKNKNLTIVITMNPQGNMNVSTRPSNTSPEMLLKTKTR